MCGIFGIITLKPRAIGRDLTAGGKRLSYRGYDSVGCAVMSDGKIDLRKDVGKVDEVSKKLKFSEMHGDRGVMQLRWATFGAPSKNNAQPHLDCDGDMVGAHNGNIVNTPQLREQFIREGHRVRSTNDGELCIHAVEKYYDKGYNMVDSIRKAYGDLRGDYAFIIFNNKEKKLYAVKKGSGLVVGIGKDEMYCSSDLPSLLPLTKKIIFLSDGEIVSLSPKEAKVLGVGDGKEIKKKIIEYRENAEHAKKGGYEHFMLKEINEQPVAVEDLVELLDESKYADKFLDVIKSSDKVFFVGCGSSYHACLLGSYYFGNIAKKVVIPVVAPQFISEYGHTIDDKTCVVLVSQSGETKDVINAMNYAKDRTDKILGVINVIGSTLMNSSKVYLPLAAGYEVSVPATKTFINQCVMFLYLAKKMGGKSCDDMKKLSPLIKGTIESTKDDCKRLAGYLKKWGDMYCLGYGSTYGIAKEAALKIKEITYSHCEGMYSSEFKHGPLSAVKRGYPVIFISSLKDGDVMVSHMNEVTCRGGRAISIAEKSESMARNASELIELPHSTDYFSPLLAAIPAQLIAYYLSVSRGIDPDFPRNLSKTITVD
ncbi:MAG: glutamine--fructose-6-phosphate transaminase (isomerizing) [Candidatus Micrarchaeota archaeon]|nr:glutamine--fructose-6-phosphate transaminase (isomerizing) [Candidatus Micrarchaeota archaeon]